ncbi:MAG: hypothetical protein ABIG28_03250 [archaeon]
MRIRIKKRGFFGVKKIKLDGQISRVDKGEGMHIFIRGVEGLGLVSLSLKEMQVLKEKAKGKDGKKGGKK